jgi:peptidoglycan/LPS O-acetylase OafA/YrhL
VLVWFAVSAAYTAYLVHCNVDFALRYSTIAAGSLPFSIGALTYFVTRRVRLPQSFAIVAVLAFLLVDFCAAWLVPDVMLHGFYLGLVLNAVAVICLAQVKWRSLHPRIVRIDRLLGDLTYPMFLLHLPVAYVWTAILQASTRPSSTALLLLGVPTLNVAALLAVRLVDRRIEPSRAVVRATAATVRVAPVMTAAAPATMVAAPES